MENEFKKIYDPSRKVTYEQPSQFSNYRMVMAAQSQASSGDPEDPPVSFNIKDHFLVGEVAQGEFGKHNHDEFWDILSQKDTLDFLDQVVGKEQQRKAKKKADREGKIEAVITVIAIVAASIVTGGAAAVALAPMLSVGAGSAAFAISAGIVGSYIAYKGYQGYQAGGVAGGILAAGSAAASMLGPAGMSIGGSYTKEQGFGFNVGGQLKGTPLSAGIGFSEKGGFGFNAGVKLSDNVSLNMNVHESGAWGVGASFHMTDGGGDRRGLAANVGYRETADGQVGRSAGFGLNTAIGNGGTLYTGLTTDSLLGNGFLMNIEEENNGPNAGGLKGYEGEIGWSTGGGFQSSLSLKFNNQRFRNALKGKGFSSDQEVELAEFDLLHKDKSDLERAKLKREGNSNLPLTDDEKKALETEAKKEEAKKHKGAGILNGAGRQVAKKNEKVRVELDGKEKSEFLTKAKDYLVSKFKEAAKGEGEAYDKLKLAIADFEKNPNIESSAKLMEAYEKTASSMIPGFVPVAGDVIDGMIALKDVYRGNYFDATVSVAATFLPFVPASAAKKMIKVIEDTPIAKKLMEAIANSPTAKKLAETNVGKWLAAKFGKKADDAVGQSHHLLSNKIIAELDNHPTLKGVFNREDPSFIYKAQDKTSHNGYQTWHREYNKIVVDYLVANPNLSKAEFKLYLHKLHQQPWLKDRIPNVNLKD